MNHFLFGNMNYLAHTFSFTLIALAVVVQKMGIVLVIVTEYSSDLLDDPNMDEYFIIENFSELESSSSE